MAFSRSRRRAGRPRALHLPSPRLADRGHLLPAGSLRRAGGPRHRRRAGADRGGLRRRRRGRPPERLLADPGASTRPRGGSTTASAPPRLSSNTCAEPADALAASSPASPSPGLPPAPRAAARRRDQLGALRRRDPAARRGALEPRPRGGFPRPHLRARERREARPPAALRGAGARLSALARPRRLPPRPQRAARPPARRGRHRHRRDRRRGGGADLQIEAVPAAQISRVFPTAACFIVPGETDWRGFLRRRSAARMRWSDQRTLGRAAIFLPLDTTPQDVRDCLNEEITQALGPATTSTACRIRSGTTTISTAWRRRST